MNRIPQDFIDELLNRVDIVDVIDSRVKLKKTGKNYSACCPFHKEKTPSFSVSPDKQFYYCFGCGASGTSIGFLMEYEHLGFIDAVENLASHAGLSVPKEAVSKGPEKAEKNLYTLVERAQKYYEAQLAEHPARGEAVSYLKNRGLTGVIAKRFGVGFAPPGWDNLLKKFGLNDLDRKLLAEAGLTIDNPESGKTYDRFRHRIMFPIIDVRGRVIGFGGRILSSASEPQRPDGKNKGAGPKYLNSPETPIFHKGRELYGLYHALQNNRKLERLLVVEGYMDVIALAQYGIENAVATLGTACGEDHLRLAFRFTSNIVFCFDGDNAGRKAAKRALENALPAMTDGRQITFLFLPEGQDPDSLVRQVGAERFNVQLQEAMPLETFFFEAVAEGIDIRTMDGRARMSKMAAPLLHRLPPGVFRELMFDALAKRTGLSLDVLQELVSEPARLTEPPPKTESTTENSTTKTEPAEIRNQPSLKLPPKPNQPVTQQNRTQGGRMRISPARLATTILLESPNLLNENINITLPERGEDPELEQLKQLLSFLRSRPRTSFHSILGYWAGQYGVEAQQRLTELVANQFLGSVKRISDSYNGQQELIDALERIRKEDMLRQHDRELAQLSSLTTLNTEQKQRMLELLQLKQQSKLNRNVT